MFAQVWTPDRGVAAAGQVSFRGSSKCHSEQQSYIRKYGRPLAQYNRAAQVDTAPIKESEI